MANATHQRPHATALQEGDRVIETGIAGTVKWYNTQKGFGFITCEDGRDVFVHHTGITTKGFATLEDGRAVTFDIADGRRGLKAINVELA